RFGDNGLISVMILRPDADADVFEIDTWVMSCRVFGRQLEFEAMNIAVEAARQRSARALRADFIATATNGVITHLYPRSRFARVKEAGPPGGTRWLLPLQDYATHPTFIARRSERHDDDTRHS